MATNKATSKKTATGKVAKKLQAKKPPVEKQQSLALERTQSPPKKMGMWARFKAVPRGNPIKTMVITIAICLVGSVFVTMAAVSLRPIQNVNKLNEKRINILRVAGLYDETKSIDEMFKSIKPIVVDLRTGDYTTDVSTSFDERAAVRNPLLSKKLSRHVDIASIKRQSFYQVVYLLKDGYGSYSQVIIPIHGYGLWSTLYGFMGVGMDGNTINGLRFYSHSETPGLGGEVDNPAWQKKWEGKKIYDNSNILAISVVKGQSSGNNQVDALSGASLTSAGVNNLVRFWVGERGFGPFLKMVANGGLQ